MLWFVRKGLVRPPNPYDEGILLTNANALRNGEVLYRDVYSNYPPGIFWLVSGLLRVFGPSYTVIRVLGIVVHAAIAVVSGRLAGRIGGSRFSWLACGLSMTWGVHLLAIPFAWLIALLLALVGIDLGTRWTAENGWTSGRYAGIGVLVGVLGWFRHDLFLYCSVLGGAVFVLLMLAARSKDGRFPSVRGLMVAAIAATGTLAIVWLPTILVSGLGNVTGDLFFDQVRFVLPGRNLPMIDPFFVASDYSGLFRLPIFLAESFPAGVVLVLAAPFFAAARLILGFDRSSETGEASAKPKLMLLESGRLTFVAVFGLSIVVIPQFLQRADGTHALYAVGPALILVAAAVDSLLGRVAASGRGQIASRRSSAVRKLAGAMALLALILPIERDVAAAFSKRQFASSTLGGRFGVVREATGERGRARVAAASFLSTNAGPDDRVYVGCVSHQQSTSSELDLYFLSDRRGATKYLQFDPGLQDTERVQLRMIREFEKNKLRVMVLAECPKTEEPNRSSVPGSTVLDEWIAANFEAQPSPEGYRFLLRGSSLSV